MAKNKERKGFVKEFKEFIARGNIMDMAVGVIIGSAFTAIVNALCNNILKPLINFILLKILGADSLSNIFTFLHRVDQTDEAGNLVVDKAGNAVADLEKSIYIDWGSFINAVINFILIALVLFLIIKAFNKAREQSDKAKAELEAKKEQEEKAE